MYANVNKPLMMRALLKVGMEMEFPFFEHLLEIRSKQAGLATIAQLLFVFRWDFAQRLK
jgi:hypothetical protein